MRRILLSSAILLAGASPALAVPLFDVLSGTTDNTTKTITGSGDAFVRTNGTLSTSGTSVTVNGTSPAPGIVLDNSGIISSTNRGIDMTGANTTRNFTLNNNAGATLSGSDDGFRINVDVTSGTITVNNDGRIRSTTNGQAIDFNAINTGTATVNINNHATGVIDATGADAIRPGQNATVTNAGNVCVGTFSGGVCGGNAGAAGASNDGVDWQGHSGTLINQTGGVISGLRHGTTSDADVNVTNETGALIVGRNGSGVGSDGTGTVVNRGTIRGSWDGVANNGDGDGVDIDEHANITNFGVIEGTSAHGVDSGGQPNSSEGIAVGGGSVDNKAGGRISGAGTGMLVDNGSAGPGTEVTVVTNAGRIEGLNGFGVRLVGLFDDTIDNSGIIAGTLGAVDMGAGDDLLKLATGTDIQGLSDGGNGFDTIEVKSDATFGDVVNFEKLALDVGATLDLASDITIDELAGALVVGGGITNIAGNGFNFVYDDHNAANAYLGRQTYRLAGGGRLIAAEALPEPMSLALIVPSLMVLAAMRRRKAD